MDERAGCTCRRGIINFKSLVMFGLFKSRSQTEKLERKHAKLMEEAYKLSRIDRTAGDRKYAEAEDILKEIESLEDE